MWLTRWVVSISTVFFPTIRTWAPILVRMRSSRVTSLMLGMLSMTHLPRASTVAGMMATARGICQQDCGQDGYRRVFGPADLHCAVEGISSSHYELIQWLMPLFCVDSVAYLERAPLSCFGKDRGKVHLYAVLSTV